VRPQDFGLRLFWFDFNEPAESEAVVAACGVTAKNLRDARWIVSERLFAGGHIPPHQITEDVTVEGLAELPSDFDVPMFRGIWYPEMIPMAGGYTGIARTPAGRALIISADPHWSWLPEMVGHRRRWILTVRDQITDTVLTSETLATENGASKRVDELFEAIEDGAWPATEER
jgi:hypothetical protein